VYTYPKAYPKISFWGGNDHIYIVTQIQGLDRDLDTGLGNHTDPVSKTFGGNVSSHFDTT